LPPEFKSRLEAAVERARKALRGDDLNEIRAAQEELSKAFSEAGQSFYAQTQTAGRHPCHRPGRPEDVVEADYEIVDEGKK
jgi:molecular chaperone DnaK